MVVLSKGTSHSTCAALLQQCHNGPTLIKQSAHEAATVTPFTHKMTAASMLLQRRSQQHKAHFLQNRKHRLRAVTAVLAGWASIICTSALSISKAPRLNATAKNPKGTNPKSQNPKAAHCGLDVQVGLQGVPDQHPHSLSVPLLSRPVQPQPLVLVLHSDVAPQRQQLGHHCSVAAQAGPHEDVPAIAALVMDGEAQTSQQLHKLKISRACKEAVRFRNCDRATS